jgi:hypothetical protein
VDRAGVDAGHYRIVKTKEHKFHRDMNPPPLPSPSDEEKSPAASSCFTVSSPTSTSTSTTTGDQQQHSTVAAITVNDDGQLNDMAKKPKKLLEIIHNDSSSSPMPIPLLAARLHDTTASSSSSSYFASYLIKDDVNSSPLPRLEVINDFDNNAPIPSVLDIDMVVGATMMKQKSLHSIDRIICGVIENKHNIIMTVSSSKVGQNWHSEQPPTYSSTRDRTQTSFPTAPPPPLEEIVIERRTPVNNHRRDDGGNISPLNANDNSICMVRQLIASKVAYGHGIDPAIITAPTTTEQRLSVAEEGGAPPPPPPPRRSLESSQTEEHQIVDDPPLTVLEATLVVDDVVYDAIPFDFKAKQHNDDDDDDEIPPHPGWCQRRIRCASIVLVLIAAIATTSSLVMLKRNKSYQSTFIEAGSVGDELLGDGEACKSSRECNNGCCSSYNSNEGFYKCTVVDGGLLADGICVDGVEEPTKRNGTNEYGIRGDWEACTDSRQCSNGCCSNNYSDDGFYKCTILTGGYRSDICVGGGGNNNEEGGARGDWEACFYSNQCSNGCCSNSYSDDGFYKCTILDGGYRSDICV